MDANNEHSPVKVLTAALLLIPRLDPAKPEDQALITAYFQFRNALREYGAATQ